MAVSQAGVVAHACPSTGEERGRKTSRAPWPASWSAQGSTCLHLPRLDYQYAWYVLELNSGPCACKASVLLTEQFFLAHFVFKM